jgi:hypothetical protein
MLTEAEAERLALVIESCAEVQHIACKILRHGYESVDPTERVKLNEDPETNRNALERELGDLIGDCHLFIKAGDIDLKNVDDWTKSRPGRRKKYLHHQEE